MATYETRAVPDFSILTNIWEMTAIDALTDQQKRAVNALVWDIADAGYGDVVFGNNSAFTLRILENNWWKSVIVVDTEWD